MKVFVEGREELHYNTFNSISKRTFTPTIGRTNPKFMSDQTRPLLLAAVHVDPLGSYPPFQPNIPARSSIERKSFATRSSSGEKNSTPQSLVYQSDVAGITSRLQRDERQHVGGLERFCPRIRVIDLRGSFHRGRLLCDSQTGRLAGRSMAPRSRRMYAMMRELGLRSCWDFFLFKMVDGREMFVQISGSLRIGSI